MKYCIGITFIVVCLAVLTGTAHADITTGLVGHWQFDEGSGTAASDSSGNGNNATLNGGPIWTSGFSSGALDFDGTDDNVATDNNLSLGNRTFTISAWVKPDVVTPSAWKRIVDFENNRVAFYGGEFRVYWTGGNYHTTVNVNASAANWYHIVGIINGGNKTVSIYVNGNLLVNEGDSYLINSSVSEKVYIGGTQSHLNGTIDDVRFYARALSTQDVQELYESGLGAVSHWKFDEGSGTAAADSVGTNTGTLAGGTTWFGGPMGQALNFDGVNDRVNAGSGSSLDNIPQLTFAAWINPTMYQTYGPSGTIALKGSGAISLFYEGWTLAFYPSGNNTLDFRAKFSSQDLWVRAVPSAITTGVWQHIAVTWDGSNQASSVHIYKNGAEVSYTMTQNGVGTRVGDGSRDLWIGNYDYLNGTLLGYLDDVRIYNKAWSGSMVKSLYDSYPWGTININATLDGQPWPSSGTGNLNFTVSGIGTINGTVVPKTQQHMAPGNYTINYVSGAPYGYVLDTYTPAQSQQLFDDSTITFTMNFVQAFPLSQCSDALNNNDGDLLVDYPADPGCIDSNDDNELNDAEAPCGGEDDGLCMEDLMCDENRCYPVCHLSGGTQRFDFSWRKYPPVPIVPYGQVGGYPNEYGPYEFDIISGWYKVDLESFDRHPEVNDETDEMWLVRLSDEVFNYYTPNIADILNTDRYKIQEVSPAFNLPIKTWDITAMHYITNPPAPPSGTVYPVCARFTSVPPPPPDYSLYSSPAGVYATIFGKTKGAVSSKTTIYVTPLYGFLADVNLTSDVASVIPGATHNFSDTTLSSSEYSTGSILSFNIPAGTSPGLYNVAVTGSGGGLPNRYVFPALTVNVLVRDPGMREVLRPMPLSSSFAF